MLPPLIHSYVGQKCVLIRKEISEIMKHINNISKQFMYFSFLHLERVLPFSGSIYLPQLSLYPPELEP